MMREPKDARIVIKQEKKPGGPFGWHLKIYPEGFGSKWRDAMVQKLLHASEQSFQVARLYSTMRQTHLPFNRFISAV